ncbi:MAG TPA: mucoidy inhibitor MuiA family protein, partial [Vulgatibacter sp.]|nr:mucoidy inhibitor MuiA family protein [Vulgatibacter sp.]
MNARLLAAILLLLPSLAVADLRVPSALEEVTVYPGSALVTRRGRTTVPKGEVRIHLEGLTPRLLDDSVRVETSGSARARILGIRVEAEPRSESTSAPLREAESALRALEDRDRELQDEAAIAAKTREFLDALRATFAKERSENLGTRAANPREWASMVDYLGKEYAAIQQRVRRVEADRRELAPKIDAARAEVNRLRATGAMAGKRVAIDLAVAREGSLAFELVYRVPDASWRPAWDARLDSATGKVELGLQAVVEQRTGEDWQGVTLAVSTARPEQRIHLVELEPLYLRKARPPVAYAGRRGAAQSKVTTSEVYEYDDAIDVESAPPPARFDESVVATTVTATGKASVPSTGEARRSPLGVFALEAKLTRTASPRLDERAYLLAEAKNGTGVPLFAGP